MPTNTAGSVARSRAGTQQIHYVRFALNYNSASVSGGVDTGKVLPSGAIVVGTDVLVTTTFNAATTNVVTLGFNGTTANDIVASGDVNEASAQMFSNIAATVAMPLTADKTIYMKYTQTGTAATQGAAHVIVKYALNNG